MKSIFEVGKRFPLNQYDRMIEGMFAQLQPEAVNFIACLADPNPKEIRDFRSGNITYGLFIANAVPFFIFDFGNWSLDASTNIFKIQEDYRPQTIEGSGNLSTMYLVDIRTFELKAMRAIGIEHRIMKKYRKTLVDQLERYKESLEVDRAIGGIIRSYTTAEMLEKADTATIRRKKRKY